MLKKLYNHLFCQPHMARRIPVLLVSVIVMGMCVAVFEKLQVGTDPCTVFTLAMANDVLKLDSLGTFQMLFHLSLAVVILLLKEGRFLGLGSLANMTLVGYARDLFRPVVEMMFPGEVTDMVVFGGVFVLTTGIFLLTVAFYMVVELGASPYDAIPQILSKHLPKIRPAVIRIAFDVTVTVIGYLLGGTVGMFTIAACLFLGPVISAIAAKFRPWFN